MQIDKKTLKRLIAIIREKENRASTLKDYFKYASLRKRAQNSLSELNRRTYNERLKGEGLV
jgi:hypothetical protein